MTLFQSLNREVSEELGLDIDFNDSNTKLFMAYKKYEDVTFSETPVPFVFLCYLYECRDLPDIILSHEHTSSRWIHEDEIDKIDHWRSGFDTIVHNAFSAQIKTNF